MHELHEFFKNDSCNSCNSWVKFVPLSAFTRGPLFKSASALVLAFFCLLALLSTVGAAPSALPAAAQPGLKLFVDQPGFYRLTHDELVQTGFALAGVDPRKLTLTAGGVETALWISGEEDGVFDTGDWLLFYGVPLDTLYTGTNVYWLTVGDQPGQRMTTRVAAPTGLAPLAESFTATVHAEVNDYYWQTLPNGQGQEHWFWHDKLTAPTSRDRGAATPVSVPDNLFNESVMAGAPVRSGEALASREESVDLPGLVPDTPALLHVRLQGRTSSLQQPNHRAQLRVNGTIATAESWSGQVAVTVTAALSGGVALSGVNVVGVDAISITQDISQFFLDWIEFDYQRMYTVTDNQLAFAGPESGDFVFQIDGFTSADPLVFDVTDPLAPVQLTGVVTETVDSGLRARFEEATSADTRYLALTSDQFRTPASALDTPSAWGTASQGVDYILITAREYMTAVVPLVEHRQAQGLRVAVVDMTDLYDEFSHGVFTPQAIRDFLAYAWENWQSPRPRYVLLVGDANSDYRDYLDRNTPNTVPTQLVQTAILGDTPSDNWFVAVEGDDPLPEMSIGRLSVQSVADVETIIDKILTYENTTPALDWGWRAVLVADDDSAVFESMSEKLGNLLPVGFNADYIFARLIPAAERAAHIVEAFNQGALLINYSGHGAVERWGGNNAPALLGPEEVASLTNGSRLPVVTVANCLSGFFSSPLPQVSLAERLQRLSTGGAVAVFAPTALNYPVGHEELFKSFYNTLFNTEGVTLGQAMDTAKAEVYAQSTFWGELVEMYVLFGDPAMPFVVPDGSLLFLPTVTAGE